MVSKSLHNFSHLRPQIMSPLNTGTQAHLQGFLLVFSFLALLCLIFVDSLPITRNADADAMDTMLLTFIFSLFTSQLSILKLSKWPLAPLRLLKSRNYRFFPGMMTFFSQINRTKKNATSNVLV